MLIMLLAGPGANLLYSSVFSSVLNSSQFVHQASSAQHGDTYYFSKPESWQATQDIAQLRSVTQLFLVMTVNYFYFSRVSPISSGESVLFQRSAAAALVCVTDEV